MDCQVMGRSGGMVDPSVKLGASTQARMAELVYAHDSGSCLARGVGSIPTPGTRVEVYPERNRRVQLLSSAPFDMLRVNYY